MKLDLKEWIAKVTGQTEFKTLLWTNSSPDSAFASQTILNNGELNGFDEVEIWASFLSLNSPVYSTRVLMGTSNSLAFQNLNTLTASNASTFINGVARDVSVSTNGIAFGYGQMTYNGGAYTNWNDRAIPYKVYGIRYVGGVARKLLNTLKTLTLGRGWAV